MSVYTYNMYLSLYLFTECGKPKNKQSPKSPSYACCL